MYPALIFLVLETLDYKKYVRRYVPSMCGKCVREALRKYVRKYVRLAWAGILFTLYYGG